MSEIDYSKILWLHDAATEFASTGMKMTMSPDEVLQLTTPLLALRERAEPVGTVKIERDWSTHRNIATVVMRDDLVLSEMRDGDALYTAPPAPVADDDSEIKWRELALQFDGHRMQAICFLKQILNELPEAEFSSARDFLKSGPLSGEEVLRNRIAALAPPAPVVHDEIIDLLHTARSYVKSCAGSDGHAFGVLRAIDRVCRSSMLQPVSQSYKLPDEWIACSDQLPKVGDEIFYCCQDDGIMDCGIVSSSNFTGRGDAELFVHAEGYDLRFGADITHWMPLPEAPAKN